MKEPRTVVYLEILTTGFCPQWEPAGRVDSGNEVEAMAAARRVAKKSNCRCRAVSFTVLWDSGEDGGPGQGTDLPPVGMMELWLEGPEPAPLCRRRAG